MSDYISRDVAIIEFMDNDIDHIQAPNGKEAVQILSDIPAADVVPVVHARWIKYTGMGKVQWMCSKCSAEEKNPKVANYCYYCGAKMDA